MLLYVLGTDEETDLAEKLKIFSIH